MGRESAVACIPTSFISGGSCAPMENSPPVIQTIPRGALPGAGTIFGIVAREFRFSGGSSSAVAGKEELAPGKVIAADPGRLEYSAPPSRLTNRTPAANRIKLVPLAVAGHIVWVALLS